MLDPEYWRHKPPAMTLTQEGWVPTNLDDWGSGLWNYFGSQGGGPVQATPYQGSDVFGALGNLGFDKQGNPRAEGWTNSNGLWGITAHPSGWSFGAGGGAGNGGGGAAGSGGASGGSAAGSGAAGGTKAAGAAGGGGMGWSDWGQLALSAYGEYTAAERAKKAANSGQSGNSFYQPWDEALPYLQGALPEGLDLYNQAKADLAALKARRSSGGYSGGGGASYSGPDPDSVVGADQQEIAARMKQLAMNGDPLTAKAKGYVGSMFPGDGGEGGDPFGYNPIYADLNNRLKGVSYDRGINYLEKFLAGNSPEASSGPPAGTGSLPRRQAGITNEALADDEANRAVANARATRAARQTPRQKTEAQIADQARYLESQGKSPEEARAIASQPIVPGPGMPGATGGVPDTVGGSNSFFAQQVKGLWDPAAMDPANNPALAPYVAELRRKMEQDRDAQLAQVGDQYAGLGMFGSSGKALESSRTRGASDDALSAALAGVYMQDYNGAWDRRMTALGLTNQRDLGAMADATDRYGIEASADAAAGGAAAAAAANRESLALQRELGMRGQDLDAINALLGFESGGLKMLGGLGDALSSDRQFGVGAAAQFNDLEMGNYERALKPFQGFDQQRAAAQAERSRFNQQQAAMAAEQAAREREWDYQDLTAGQNLFGDYLSGLGMITNMGPHSTTTTAKGGGYTGPGGWEAAGTAIAGGLMNQYGSRRPAANSSGKVNRNGGGADIYY